MALDFIGPGGPYAPSYPDFDFVAGATAPPDTSPDPFSFAPVTQAPLDTEHTSETITVTGINVATPISVTGGLYAVNGFWTADPGTVLPGDDVQVRVTSAGAYEETVTATLTIGDVSANFVVTTTAVPLPLPAPGVILNRRTRWQMHQQPAEATFRLIWAELLQRTRTARLPQRAAELRDRAAALAWGEAQRRDLAARLPYGAAVAVEHDIELPWSRFKPRDTGASARWAWHERPVDEPLSLPWSDPPRKERGYAAPTWTDPQTGGTRGYWHTEDAGYDPAALNFFAESRTYTPSYPTMDFIGTPNVVPPPQSEVLIWQAWPDGQARLVRADHELRARWADLPASERALWLRWGPGAPTQGGPDIPWEAEPPPDEPDPSTIVVPPLKVYVVTNTIAVVRLPDLTPIEALAVSASVDAQAWSWRIRLTLGREADLTLLDPVTAGPREVQITVNGFTLVGVVESYSRDRQFARGTWTVEARSPSAYLAEPYATPRSLVSSGLASAQQLALAELPSGWTLIWQIPDWSVPAGAWSYDQLTPIQAIARIAAAAGAVVQPDPAAQTLRVVSRYPVSPDDWATATPAAIYTDAVLTRMGSSYSPAPTRNAVIVEGGTQGVRVIATRQGTAGDDPMPSITEPLCTALECGMERARVELDATGDRIEQSFALPILATLGVRLPGSLDQITAGGSTWRGLVRSTSITATRTQDGVRVGQEVTVERMV